MNSAISVEKIIHERLKEFVPESLEIYDDSALHRNHAGAQEGGHFRLYIVAACFVGKRTVDRHRMVYDALGALGPIGIHALEVVAKTPNE